MNLNPIRLGALSCLSLLLTQQLWANPTTASPNTDLAQLPLSFEANQGQADPAVDFVTHGAGYGLFLSHAGAVMVLNGKAVVRMTPVNANRSGSPEGIDKEAAKSNYFIGNDPAKWHSNIVNYLRVHYRDIYPGVDILYYGNQRQLEYDFVAEPNADIDKIALRFDGGSEVQLSDKGALVLHTQAGDLTWHKPVAYQTLNGVRRKVACAYVRKGVAEFGFSLADYDKSHAVVIDPVIEYSTYLGGTGIYNIHSQFTTGDFGQAIAIDSHNDIYVTGTANSTDFPVKNPLQSQNGGSSFTSNAFISEFDSSGHLLYSTYLGGTGLGGGAQPGLGDIGNSIAVDSAGNVYIAGQTASLDFPQKNPLSITAFQLPIGFVAKLAPGGSSLIYSTYLGGDSIAEVSPPGDSATGITVDASGHAYVTGVTYSTNFPTTPGAFQTVAPGGTAVFGGNGSAFVTKFNPTGGLVYSTYLGGTDTNSTAEAISIALDAAGNAYIAGFTQHTTFPTTSNALQRTRRCATSGCRNAFFTKLNASGNALLYSTYLGGSVNDVANSVAVDTHGNAYLTGMTSSPNFPVKNAFQSVLKSKYGNAFVTKFTAANTLAYSTYLGGTGQDRGTALKADPYGNVYLTGATISANFPVVNAFQPILKSVYGNGFVTKIDATGCRLIYSSYLGGSGDTNFCQPGFGVCYNPKVGDAGYGIVYDTQWNVYVAGTAGSTNFPVTSNAFQDKNNSVQNAFLTKISAR